VQILERVIREGFREIDAGVVDERVDRSEFAGGGVRDFRRGFGFGDVSVNQRELI
jgi:hypothetical protein